MLRAIFTEKIFNQLSDGEFSLEALCMSENSNDPKPYRLSDNSVIIFSVI